MRGLTRGWVVARLPRPCIEPDPDLAQSLNVKTMAGQDRRFGWEGEGVIGTSQSDGEMASVRELDDEIRINSSADGDDLHHLSREGMMGMDDRGVLQGFLR